MMRLARNDEDRCVEKANGDRIEKFSAVRLLISSVSEIEGSLWYARRRNVFHQATRNFKQLTQTHHGSEKMASKIPITLHSAMSPMFIFNTVLEVDMNCS